MNYEYLLDLLYEAYYDCRRNKRNKPSAMEFEANYETNLRSLAHELLNKAYRISPSIVFGVTRPKDREVFAANFRDRVVHHLLMRKLEPLLENEMIEESFNCRKGKGTFYGINIFARQIKDVSNNYQQEAWCLSIDMQGFFMSIDKQKCWQMLERVILDKWIYGDRDWWLWLTKMIVLHKPEENCEIHGDPKILQRLPDNKTLFRSNGKGLPIGNLTSQIFGNYYMTPFDHWSKKYLNGRGTYCRYVDDVRVVSTDIKMLKRYMADAREWLRDNLAVNLHPNKWSIQSAHKGIPFIGAIVHRGRIYTSNRTISNAFSVFRLENVHDIKLHVCRLNSYNGFLVHNATYAIRYNLYNAIPDTIKKHIVCTNMRKYQARKNSGSKRRKWHTHRRVA